MTRFSARIFKIGVNPYVSVPVPVLRRLFKDSGKDKSPIPVSGTIDGRPFRQTLVRYKGRWRLYLNTPMRKSAGVDVGDTARFQLEFDPTPRIEPMPELLAKKLKENKRAMSEYAQLPPSRQKEICRYLNFAKTEATRVKNVQTVIGHLTGKNPKLLRPIMRRKKKRSRVPV